MLPVCVSHSFLLFRLFKPPGGDAAHNGNTFMHRWPDTANNTGVTTTEHRNTKQRIFPFQYLMHISLVSKDDCFSTIKKKTNNCQLVDQLA